MPGYKPPPSTQQQLPDVGMDVTLPPTASQRAVATPPVATQAPLTKQQQIIKMMQDSAAAMKARDSAQDDILKQYMGTKMTTPGDPPPMTVKAPGGSGAPTE